MLLIALSGCASTPDASQESTPQGTTLSAPTSSPTTLPDRQPHTLVLNATGTGAASITALKYTLDGRTVQEGPVTMPWRRSLRVPADGLPHSYRLEVEYSGSGGGKIDLVAIYDGEVSARGGGVASGTPGTQVSGGAAVTGTVQG